MYSILIGLSNLFVPTLQLGQAVESPIIAENVPKNLQIAQIEINEQFIDFRRLQDATYRNSIAYGTDLYQSFDSIAPFTNYPITLDLPHYLNNLTFYISAKDWAAPHKMEYSYYLKGLEKGWSKPQKSPKVVYEQLPTGTYTLMIKARGRGKIWCGPIPYPFHIRPAWWQTYWAYSVYTISTFGLLYGLFFYWRMVKQDKQKVRRLKEEYGRLTLADSTRKQLAAKEDEFLEQVRYILENNLSDENFGIAELCEFLNISRTQLHRKIKDLTGLSTSHYIRYLRLSVAKNLLAQTNLNISEVAFKVGFSSASYFSRAFKQEYGYAPKSLR